MGPWVCKDLHSTFLDYKFQDRDIIIDLPPSDFSDIDLTNVVAGFIPYHIDHYASHLSTVELSNKTFSFFANKLPLITRGLPNFLDSVSTYKISSIPEIISALNHFNSIDPSSFNSSLIDFVSKHTIQIGYQFSVPSKTFIFFFFYLI